jgi:hydroxymethylpyrimidine/phosphomethylpyrimidine kinase
MSVPIVLSIAGLDPSGGAGVLADVKTFTALGVYGAGVVTAITVQNTRGVQRVVPQPAALVAEELAAVLADLPVAAVKIGMLATAEIVRAVAGALRDRPTPVVLDPVLVSSSGAPLLDDAAVAVLFDELLPLATLVTPNLPEAARLLGDMLPPAEAGARLLQRGAQAVLVKGGHGEGDTLEDVLVTCGACAPLRLRHPRVETPHTHGTGCALSSAIAAGLAQGLLLHQAVERAVTWLHGALLHAYPTGAGTGPVHHAWQIWPETRP